MRRLSPILLLLILACSSAGETKKIVFLRLGLRIVQERVGLVPLRDEDRAERLRQLFTQAGCPSDHIQIQNTDSELPNVICTIPGSGLSTLIIGAHYDHRGGTGALDNWSGAAMLPILAESIGSVAMKHTLIFIAFGGKYHGASGSRVYMRRLTPDQQHNIAAMINLDSIGLVAPHYWPDNNGLIAPLQLAALNVHMPQLKSWQIEHDGLADMDVFRKAKIASITIHSLGRPDTDMLYVVHSKDDTVKALDMRAYYQTYELLSVYLAYLDQVTTPFRVGDASIPQHDKMGQPGPRRRR